MNYLGFTPQHIEKTSKSLNQLLCNYQVYYQNLRNYHWNIKGQHFFDLHLQFEDLYNEAKLNIDQIAERVLTLRKKPISTLKEYLSNAKVKEKSSLSAEKMVGNILSDHKILIVNMRELLETAGDARDEGTIDLIAGFLASIEKKSWMLDAWRSK